MTRLLLGADVVFDDGASSGSTDGDDTRSADVAGIARPQGVGDGYSRGVNF